MFCSLPPLARPAPLRCSGSVRKFDLFDSGAVERILRQAPVVLDREGFLQAPVWDHRAGVLWASTSGTRSRKCADAPAHARALECAPTVALLLNRGFCG